MPLVIKETPEPLTFASQSALSILAECDAYRSLLRDILRYGRRETMGRSVLIAGHRGSGKTTLVRLAIQIAQGLLRDEHTATRPLLVALHGPDLLGGEAVLAQATISMPAKPLQATTPAQEAPPAPAPNSPKAATIGVASEGNGSESKAVEDTRAALRMLTEGLHRAFITELGQAFALRIGDADETREICAQLQVELDHAPELDSLRFIWNKAGRLQDGVLFAQKRSSEQGLRELVAASVAIEAYQRVAGKLENVQQSDLLSKLSQSLEQKKEWGAKELINSLTGLLAGGVAGAGVLLHNGQGASTTLLAAMAALITAIAGTGVLNYSSSRTRQTTRQKKQSFTWDTSIASLDRMLPMMVHRIVEAGLTPIFVVDELDKIPGIERKMENLIRHLKHLVTEKTFFCFLTDRSYFEHVVASSRTKAYGREHTFFSSRLFVHYRPVDLHQYLTQICTSGEAADINEQFDLQLLPFLLLGRAKMHPIDLRRTLYEITDEKGVIRLPVGDIRSLPGYTLSIFMQAAVEVGLEEQELSNRLRVDPNFSRLAYDALYVPFRSWEAGDNHLCGTRDYLKGKLQERMKAEDSTEQNYENLSEGDLDLLYASFRHLCGLLRKPEMLLQEIAGFQNAFQSNAFQNNAFQSGPSRFKDAMWNTLRDVVKIDMPLLGEEDEAHNSSWLRDAYGALRTPPVVSPPSVTTDRKAAVALPAEATGVAPQLPPEYGIEYRISQIRDWDQFIREITEERLDLNQLASLRLLSVSPAWPSVENAIRAYERAASSSSATTDATTESHRSVIEQYGRMLETATRAMRRALILSTLMAPAVPGTGYARLLTRSLGILAADLRFSKCDIDQIETALAAFEEPVRQFAEKIQAPIDKLMASPNVSTWMKEFKNWLTVLRALKLKLPEGDMDSHQSRWVQFFLSRFRTGKSVFAPDFNDLLLRAADQAIPFKTDFEDMTYADYAKVWLWLESRHAAPDLWDSVIIELGFAKEYSEIASTQSGGQHTEGQIDLLEICRTSVRLQKTGQRVLLVIGGAQEQEISSQGGYRLVTVARGEGSLVGGWRISSRHAVFPVFGSDTKVPLAAELSRSRPMPVLTLADPEAPIPESAKFPQLYFRVLASGVGGPGDLAAPSDLDTAVEMALKKSKAS